jgi:hypothetical protein
MTIQEDFDKMFKLYWYDMKPLHRRLCDSQQDEKEVCALFFETLNQFGMLDKTYPIKKLRIIKPKVERKGDD